MIQFGRRALARLVLIAALGCAGFPLAALAEGPAPAAGAAASTKGPTVFAAASMKTALDAIAAAWTAQTGKSPSIVYGSSAVLAKQIEQDAPADIFISADLNWMDYLDKAKLLRPGTRRNVLGNELVLIEPADSSAALKIEPGFDLAGATGDGKIAVCTIASCRGGIYAKQALTSLGVWDKVEPKLAQADNIRSALTLVARGEAHFGIVYATDAKAEPKVKVIGTFPASSHSPIIYPVAILASSKNPDAEAFVAFLSSQAATKILLDQGFSILSK
jgi:molybdate transport system substrate-binding protein